MPRRDRERLQILHNTSRPEKSASPVVLRMLFMHSSKGLAILAGIVVLRRFWAGAMAPASRPSRCEQPGRETQILFA
jgi:hypothetical protein